MRFFKTLFVVAGLLLALLVPSAAFARPVDDQSAGDTPDFYATGLNQPTSEQTDWMNKNVPAIKNIRLNQIALDRINADRAGKGLKRLLASDVDVAPLGDEAVFGTSGETSSGATVSSAVTLPGSVDNSLSPAFPPIRSQGGVASCTAWATTYYQFTYENNLARGRTASGGDNTVIFSPKWTYNMINGGADGGAYFSDAYALEIKNGATNWAEFPYDSNYLQWCLDTAAWRDAINYRPSSYGQISNSNTDQLIDALKTQLANGHVVVIGTYVYSWVAGAIANDPSTTLDDGYVGQRIATYMKNTNQGGHAMTVVGYNDDIWVDLNGNGVVDPGEKGAFKVANSWGTGDWNGGYRWVAYDALRTISAAPASGTWPTADRASGGIFWNDSTYTLTASPSYTPSAVAQITLNSAERGQLVVTLGTGSTTATHPAATWTSKALSDSGGNYAFDGTTTACDGTFVFDFSELAASASGMTRWFDGLYDGTTGSSGMVKSLSLYQVTAGSDVLLATASNTPKSVSRGQVYVWADAALNSSNQSPVAVITASPTSGNIPLVVSFDGSSSTDATGQIVSYAWDFGDGATGSGVTSSHTYSATGTYTARLTVTDDKGASGSNSVTITSSAPVVNQPPTAVVSASPTSGNAPLAVSFSGSSSTDADGQIVSYAWDFGDGSVASGVSATHTYAAGSYTAKLTVTDDKGATSTASLSITVAAANRPPVAVIVVSPSNGTVGQSMSFDGSGSSDPDGIITACAWNFGDGSTATGAKASHTYAAAGSYTVNLTVTDNGGATGSASAVVSVTDPNALNAPSGLTATVNQKIVTLTWVNNSTNGSGFYIERGVKVKSQTTFIRVGTVSAIVTTYTDTPGSGTYVYRVQAFNSTTGAISPFSNVATVRVR